MWLKANEMQRHATTEGLNAASDRRRRRAPIVNASLIGSALLVFTILGTQILSLGLSSSAHMSMSVSEPVATSFSRPDIIDRNGRLLATDVEAPSLFADPAIVIDRQHLPAKHHSQWTKQPLVATGAQLATVGLRAPYTQPSTAVLFELEKIG